MSENEQNPSPESGPLYAPETGFSLFIKLFIVPAVIVLVALFFVSPAINFIPVPSLAVHLVRIGWKMLNRDQIRLCLRATKSDAIVFAATMLAAKSLARESMAELRRFVMRAHRRADLPRLMDEVVLLHRRTLRASGSLRSSPRVLLASVEGEARDARSGHIQRLSQPARDGGER